MSLPAPSCSFLARIGPRLARLSDANRAVPRLRSVSAIVVLVPLVGGCRDPRADTGSPPPSIQPSASAPARSSEALETTNVTSVSWRSPSQLGVGPGGTCAIANGGHVYCWGIPLGPTSGSLPALLAHPRPFEQISRDNVHACARTAEGDVWCAGRNDDGQLGAESKEKCIRSVARDGTVEQVPCSGSLLRVDGLPPIADVVTGYYRSCAIGRNGRVYCWGMGFWGVLGITPDEPCDCARSPVEVPGLDNVRALALGAFFSCALRTDGTVRCWGSNTDGERGQGTYDQRPRWDKRDKDAVEPPVVVGKLSGIVEIAAGSMHVCALGASRRRLWCWGSNRQGQLGVDTPETTDADDSGNHRSATPTEVVLPDEIGEISAIAAGGSATCALGASGSLFCWGAFEERRRQTGPRPPIRRVREAPPLAAISLDSDRLCGVNRTGKIVCWGGSTAPDQLGFPSKPGRCSQGCREPPTELSGLVIDMH
jgi:alpha-tubulin suppressor-like RCC1 family protein